MRPFLLALALTGLTGPACAALYECRFQGENSWVPTVVVVEAGAEGDEVRVFDPLIKRFQGRPIKALVEIDNAARTTFTWKLRVESPQNQSARLSVRMTRLKRDATASISVTPLGFQGPFSGVGRCQTTSGKL